MTFNVLYKDDKLVLAFLSENIGRVLWPGYYVRLPSRSWYFLEEYGAILRRMRHAGQYRRLETLYLSATNPLAAPPHVAPGGGLDE